MIPQVQPWLGEEEVAAVCAVVRSGWLTEGPVCDAFDQDLRQLTGAPHGVFAPNGTLALTLGLLALGIGPGDEVLVPDITFVGSATAVRLAGAHPVFVDVLPGSYQMDVTDAAARITPATRAVMPVHLYGSACDLHAVLSLAAKHGLRVIEDAAQGIGVHFDGRHVGTFGDVGCFSFFADKTVTTGEGGYVTCRDERIWDRLRELRNQGRLERGSFQHPALGFNFRITDLQAALGRTQLARLRDILAGKAAVLAQYRSGLAGIEEVSFLGQHPLSGHVPFRVVLIAREAHALMAWLAQHRVQTRSFFHPLHRQPCFAAHPDARRPFPVADHGYDNGLCLPAHPTLPAADIEHICSCIRSFYRSRAR